MNTLETNTKKIPGDAQGASDLLDSLVQDDLQRVVPEGARAPSAEDTAAEAEVNNAETPGVEMSEDQRNDLLKREIDMLLAGTPVEGAPKEPGSAAPAEEVAASSEVPQGEGEKLSQAELDMLLPQAAVTAQAMEAPMDVGQAQAAAMETAMDLPQASSPAAEASMDMPPGAGPAMEPPLEMPTAAAPMTDGMPDEAEQHLAEAEGVLAEELSQLLAETQKAEMPAEEPLKQETPAAEAAAPAAETVAPAPQAVGLVEDHLEEVPPAQSNGIGEVHEAVERPRDVGAISADVAAVAPAPAQPIVETAGNVEEGTPEPARGNFLTDILLMIAQLFDIPFSWIEEVDKNVIGVIAFLLLLGGIVFRIVAWAINGH